MAFGGLIFGLGFTISVLSGFVGIGGGIIMAPALLYLPPLVGVGRLGMREVAGLTITQGLFACLSGALGHHKHHHVHRRLVFWMGGSIVVAALAGAVISRWIANEAMMAIFAGLAILAAVLMCLPKEDRDEGGRADAHAFHLPLAVIIAITVGLLGGIVGQGGSFILIPLMLHILKLPTRVVIGSNLALVFLSSLAGFGGKLATGQVPPVPAVLIVIGALPGAQVGSVLSQRTKPRWLRTVLAVVIGLAALRIAADVLADA